MKTDKKLRVKPAFASEKRRIAAWLKRHDMTLADAGVDSPATVSELTDPDIIRSFIEDIEEEQASWKITFE